MTVSTESRLRPLPFAPDSELREAAFNHGFQRDAGAADGWLWFRSDTAPGEVALAASSSHWFLAVTHAGVAAELDGERTGPAPGAAAAVFCFAGQAEMRAALSRAWHLARSLPAAPLHRFEEEIAALGETEAEAIVRQRIGQDVFRAALMDYWGGRCPLTGIDDPALLRASHIVPWAECRTDAERLDVHNGLLLSSLWDAAFDKGLVGFDDDGVALFSPRLSQAALDALRAVPAPRLPLRPDLRRRLEWHRENLFSRNG
jgi:hypothetical protein